MIKASWESNRNMHSFASIVKVTNYSYTGYQPEILKIHKP